METYLNDKEIEELEKKYFRIIKNLISSNLGKIINQICSQELINNKTTTNIENEIEHGLENIIQSLITSHLDWNTISLPACADSCFDCGDAIVHIDSKTMVLGDDPNNVNIEKNQTSYAYGETLLIGKSKNKWTPELKIYEEHKYSGYIPNLTYVVRVIYSLDNHIEKLMLICLPSGQLAHIFGNENILGAGKSKDKDGNQLNVRFKFPEITSVRGQDWIIQTLFLRKPINLPTNRR